MMHAEQCEPEDEDECSKEPVLVSGVPRLRQIDRSETLKDLARQPPSLPTTEGPREPQC